MSEIAKVENVFVVDFDLQSKNINVKNINLNLEFNGNLREGEGYQGFITFELCIESLIYEIENRETMKFDINKDFTYLTLSFYLGELRKEKKYFVIRLNNNFKCLCDKINEMENSESTETEGADSNTSDIIYGTDILSKEINILKKQNKLLIETMNNIEKTNYQNKLLEISKNLPELPYLSFTYPEWATFEDFKKVKGYDEISAAYNLKSYVIGHKTNVCNSRNMFSPYIYANESEDKYYYLVNEIQTSTINDLLDNLWGYNSYCNLQVPSGDESYNLYYKKIEAEIGKSFENKYDITTLFSRSCYIKKIRNKRNSKFSL
jgi:hypothetical protein